MARKWSLCLIVVIALLAAACGGGAAPGGGGGVGVSLTETYNADGVTFKYPSGWVVAPAAGPGGPISLANNQAALDAATSGDVTSAANGQQMISVLPLTGDAATAMTSLGSTPVELLNTMVGSISGSDLTFGEPTETTIGGKPAARAAGSGDSGDGQVIAINMGDAGYVFVIGATGKGEMGGLESTLNALAESVTLTPASG